VNASVRRILVALDASSSSRTALASAAEFAARLGAELRGVFVEDLELLELARLPLAREVGLTSAQPRLLDARTLELALAAQAKAARSALEATARRHRVPWSFRVLRGRVDVELLAAAAEVDLLALGVAGQMEMTGRRIGSTVRSVVSAARCSVLIERRRPSRKPAVLALYEDTEAADRMLADAAEFAAARGGALVVVPLGGEDVEARLHRTAHSLAPAVPVRIESLVDGAEALRRLAARAGCGLVLMTRDSRLLAREPELVGELGLPLLLCR
jgi:nucleotide-binding universal stress UspA family protein